MEAIKRYAIKFTPDGARRFANILSEMRSEESMGFERYMKSATLEPLMGRDKMNERDVNYFYQRFKNEL